MTKEELKEAIAATITENGQKGITGQALANILNEIVDAAGEGGGGGGAAGVTITLGIDLNTFSPFSDPNEGNANAFQTLAQGLTNNVAYPVNLILDYSVLELGNMVFSLEGYFLDPENNQIPLMSSIMAESFPGDILLNEDGSVTYIASEPTE